MEANKVKEGVVETASGLQYKVLKAGPEDGKTPLKTTKCLCHYKGEPSRVRKVIVFGVEVLCRNVVRRGIVAFCKIEIILR